ncbi:MAG: oligosaccharide flippase family protein [Erysipelotrichaceae bacterium]
MENKSKKLIKNSAIFMIGSIGSKFIQFFLVPLYTYTMSTEQFGVSEVILTATNLLIPVFSVSIADGLLRFGIDPKHDKGSVLKNSLIITVFGSLLSIVCSPILGLYETLSSWMPFFLIILNLRIYRDVFAIHLKIEERNLLFAIDSMVYTFVLCISNFLFLVYFKLGIYGYFIAYIVANVVSIVFLIIIGKPFQVLRNGKIDIKLLKEIFIYSLPMIVNGVSWWLTSASDKLMLDYFLGESKVGIYAAATKIPSLISTFTSVFNQAWIISAVQEYDDERDTNFFSKTFKNYYALLFIGVISLIAILKPFMSIYVGPTFVEAYKYAPLLVTSSAYSSMAAFTVGVYASTRKNINVTITTIFGAVINIGLNYCLIPIIGIMGATIATLVSWMVIFFVRVVDMKKFFPFFVDLRRIGLYTIFAICGCLLMAFFDYLIALIISIVFIIIVLILEKDLVMNLKNMITKKMWVKKS